MSADAGHSTIGVIIVIPEPHASVLSGWRQRLGDTLGEAIPPHVTLFPPTKVRAEELPAIRTHLAKAAESATAFPMHLFGTGTFRPLSPVVFIQVASGIADCELLENAIRSGPLTRDLPFPFHPHVTIAQEIADDRLDEAYEGLAKFVARFSVDHFSLFERAAEGSWSRQEDYRLGVS